MPVPYQTTALIGLVACPALALLPPRKVDFYTVGLITATGYSANFLIRERTGRSIWQTLSPQRSRAYHPFARSSISPDGAGKFAS